MVLQALSQSEVGANRHHHHRRRVTEPVVGNHMSGPKKIPMEFTGTSGALAD